MGRQKILDFTEPRTKDEDEGKPRIVFFQAGRKFLGRMFLETPTPLTPSATPPPSAMPVITLIKLR